VSNQILSVTVIPTPCRYQRCYLQLPLAETGDDLLYGYTCLSLIVDVVHVASCRQQCYNSGPVSHFSVTCLCYTTCQLGQGMARQDNLIIVRDWLLTAATVAHCSSSDADAASHRGGRPTSGDRLVRLSRWLQQVGESSVRSNGKKSVQSLV